VRAAAAAGVEFWLESPMVGLITEGDKVTGVRVSTDKGEQSVRAKLGVVLGTGGYDWNKDFVHRFEGEFDDHSSLSPPGIDGDHLVLGSAIGAAITTLPAQRGVMMLGFPTGYFDEVGQPTSLMYLPTGQHEIVVNRFGERFADESFYPSVQTAIHALDGKTHGHRNWPAWLIFDEDYLTSTLRAFHPAPIEQLRVSADTIDGLAELAGIDPTGLKKTVERYNEMAAAGRDEDFELGEKMWVQATRSLDPTTPSSPVKPAPIKRAPFYAARMTRLQVGSGSPGLKSIRTARSLG